MIISFYQFRIFFFYIFFYFFFFNDTATTEIYTLSLHDALPISLTLILNMGKIKGKLVKRSSERLIQEGIEFSDKFEKNKKVLGNTMPSKKIRNQMAGYLARLKRQEKEKKEAMQ